MELELCCESPCKECTCEEESNVEYTVEDSGEVIIDYDTVSQDVEDDDIDDDDDDICEKCGKYYWMCNCDKYTLIKAPKINEDGEIENTSKEDILHYHKTDSDNENQKLALEREWIKILMKESGIADSIKKLSEDGDLQEFKILLDSFKKFAIGIQFNRITGKTDDNDDCVYYKHYREKLPENFDTEEKPEI